MKAYFLARQLREKLLLVTIAAVGLTFWALHLVDATRTYRTDEANLTKARDEQNSWLNRASEINAAQSLVTTKLDPKQSIRDDLALRDTLDRMIADLRIIPVQNVNIATPTKPVRTPQFTILNATLTVNNLDAGMSELIQLYRKLSDKAPYINIVSSDIRLINTGNRGGGRGGPGGPNGAGAPGGAGFANTTGGPGAQPGAGRRGGPANAATGTIGALDVAVPGAPARGRGPANQPTQPTGPQLQASFTLMAISLNTTGTGASAGGTVPARASAPAVPAARPTASQGG